MSRISEQATWKAQTQFVGGTKEVMAMLPQAIAKAHRAAAEGQGKPPAVILDLDGTLADNRTRTLRIIHEWLDQPAGLLLPKASRARIDKLKPEDIQFGLEETLEAIGFKGGSLRSILTTLEPFWRDRFFHDSSYVPYDVAFPGASAFVRKEIADKEVAVIYLTGRGAELWDGTLVDLQEEGLPLPGDNAQLILNERGEPDDSFKRSVTADLAKQFGIVATFDNEPANVIAFVDSAPDAMHVFVDTSSSAVVPRPGESKDRIYRFEW